MALQLETIDEPQSSERRVTVRDAVPSDAGAIARFGTEAFIAAHERLVDARLLEAIVAQAYSEPALRHCIASCAAAADAHFLVAEEGSRLRGFLHFDSFGERPELHRIYVDRDTTGRGIGAALVSELECRLAPGSHYVLLVVAGNEGAVRFYRREGFERERVDDDGAGRYARHMDVRVPESRPVPILVMRKTVS